MTPCSFMGMMLLTCLDVDHSIFDHTDPWSVPLSLSLLLHECLKCQCDPMTPGSSQCVPHWRDLGAFLVQLSTRINVMLRNSVPFSSLILFIRGGPHCEWSCQSGQVVTYTTRRQVYLVTSAAVAW